MRSLWAKSSSSPQWAINATDASSRAHFALSSANGLSATCGSRASVAAAGAGELLRTSGCFDYLCQTCGLPKFECICD